MKRITTMLCALALAVCFCTAAAAASLDWDSAVAWLNEKEKIYSYGPELFEKTASQAPDEDEATLWEISCGAQLPEERAAASAALVKELFPDGDPSRWEEVNGFFPTGTYVPRQLVAVNALFNAVTEFMRIEDGKYTAAWLMKEFVKSSRARVIFIDNMPEEFRETLDSLLAQVNMGGAWESSKVQGPYPFVPKYGGVRTTAYAADYGLQFMDGMCGVARSTGFGYFGWDRANGRLYRLVDHSEGDMRYKE